VDSVINLAFPQSKAIPPPAAPSPYSNAMALLRIGIALAIVLLFALSIAESSIYRCARCCKWKGCRDSLEGRRTHISSRVTCRSISSTSEENIEVQKSKNADAMRIHVFIAVAMGAGARCPLFVMIIPCRITLCSFVSVPVIICKFMLVKMRGGNLSLVRAAEISLLASLFTVQVRRLTCNTRPTILASTGCPFACPPPHIFSSQCMDSAQTWPGIVLIVYLFRQLLPEVCHSSAIVRPEVLPSC
jgi:hypothetical protein